MERRGGSALTAGGWVMRESEQESERVSEQGLERVPLLPKPWRQP